MTGSYVCRNQREKNRSGGLFVRLILNGFIKMKPLANGQQKPYENAKEKFIKKNLKIIMLKIKNIVKVGTTVIIKVNRNYCM